MSYNPGRFFEKDYNPKDYDARPDTVGPTDPAHQSITEMPGFYECDEVCLTLNDGDYFHVAIAGASPAGITVVRKLTVCFFPWNRVNMVELYKRYPRIPSR